VRYRALAAAVVLVIGVGVTITLASRHGARAGTGPVPLRALAAARGVTIGSAVNATALEQEPAFGATLGTEFSGVTPEDAMKWVRVEPTQGRYDWRQADEVVDFATAHGQKVRGHTLVWYHSLPDWLTGGTFTTDELRALLKQHIETEAGRYAGRVAAWDVVNEALNPDGTLRSSIWLDRLGPGYIADAFRWAHAADPAAKLYINEFGAEWANPKSNALYALVRDLRAQGVPIDGVGFQTHVAVDSALAGLGDTLRRFAGLGVDVAITELDVRIPLPVDDAKLGAQARAYTRAVEACLAVPRCVSVTTWGFTDAHSWISSIPGYGAATLFDEQLRPKPAYDAVHAVLAAPPRAAGDPVGRWRLDEPAGPVADDSSGNARPATVSGGQLGAAGRSPARTAWQASGTGTEATTAGPVLRTDASFTVAAWVRLADKSGTAKVAVSQDGTANSAFYLMYQPTTDRWEFTVPSAPNPPLTWQTARGAASPALNTWTHLAGVYDAGARELRLYVNGVREGTATGITAWPSGGPFHIGRSFSGGRFAGTVGDVLAWDRALPASEVAAVADPRVGRWALDGDPRDGSGFGHDGVPTASGVGWTADRAGRPGAALALDGTGSLDTPGPVLHTDRSYTVSAWVRLADKAGYRTVLSQDGMVRGAVYLEYHPSYDRWAFIVPSTDTETVTWQTATSRSVPAVGAWTHLVAVYDAAAGQLRLYVNGVREGTATGVTAWPSAGPFHIGRTMSGGRFTGALDDVQAYPTALSDAQVAAL
jgi:GH35 family endo-1,4-beta-xylanase